MRKDTRLSLCIHILILGKPGNEATISGLSHFEILVCSGKLLYCMRHFEMWVVLYMHGKSWVMLLVVDGLMCMSRDL